MEETIKNCTPHLVRLNDGREFPPCGIIPRVTEKYSEWRDIAGVPACGVETGEVVGLPPVEHDVYLIVSSKVAEALPARHDLLVPFVGHPAAVRKDGQPYSVPGFKRN